MIVADTSTWIEHLRDTDHPAGRALDGLFRRNVEVAVTEIVVMELLGGVRPGPSLEELRSRLLSLPMLPLEGLADFEHAAFLFQSCRLGGETLSAMTDCLIAVPAIRAGDEIHHNDRDIDAIARHSALRVYRGR
ncbi:MAG: type II toxin-antitoxin system VapC family toxin [Actinomycetota bacterium]